MLVNELFKPTQINTDLINDISQSCVDFLLEANNQPLFKRLPSSYSDVHKVKARINKKTDVVTETFNKAFDEFSNLRQRAIIAYPSISSIKEDEMDTFYVLPINGYKFMYSREVTDSTSSYKQMIDILFEQFSNNVQAVELIADLLKFTYTTDNLIEGIQSNSEIILYGIPYYYAIRQSAYPDYQKLIQHIHKYNRN